MGLEKKEGEKALRARALSCMVSYFPCSDVMRQLNEQGILSFYEHWQLASRTPSGSANGRPGIQKLCIYPLLPRFQSATNTQKSSNFFSKKKKTLQLTRPLTCLVVIVVISRALSTNTSDPMWRYAASMFDVSRIELQNLRCIGMGVMTEYLWEYMA